ncbi:hypothetical protein [Ferrimonas kyonanensis]|uniref:hypothetical protein n=1 Tax=Ferrimonas kyonanensis TaxID=364763 RepID=UPI000482FC30|nr:hypothetical protein [Ferrimonas kyonanensis]
MADFKFYFGKTLTGLSWGIGFTLGVVLAASLYQKYEGWDDGITIDNPDFIEISEHRILDKGLRLTIPAKITNNSNETWEQIQFTVEVFDQHGFLGKCFGFADDVETTASQYQVAYCSDLDSSTLPDDSKLHYEIYPSLASRSE